MLSRRSLVVLSGAAALTTGVARAQSRNAALSQLWTRLEFVDTEGPGRHSAAVEAGPALGDLVSSLPWRDVVTDRLGTRAR